MDPFIIIHNYRQARQLEEPPAPRLFLRELDLNALPIRTVSKPSNRVYSNEDKENFNFMMELEAG